MNNQEHVKHQKLNQHTKKLKNELLISRVKKCEKICKNKSCVCFVRPPSDGLGMMLDCTELIFKKKQKSNIFPKFSIIFKTFQKIKIKLLKFFKKKNPKFFQIFQNFPQIFQNFSKIA